MSASSKKKLRKAEAAAKLTERQAAEQKEAKKLKIYSTIFCVVMIAMLIFALVFGISKTVTNNGILERNTTAAIIGGHKVSSAEMNMFYIDAINSYGQYITMFGVDTTKPLNEQVQNVETGATWADYFQDIALENAKQVYAICDLANAAGYTLPADEQATLNSNLENAEFYALMNYGYSDLETYLKAMYGNGCTEELFNQYQTNLALADSYYAHYAESLTYTSEELKAFEADVANQYSAYSYSYYTLPVDKFLTGGTTDAEGKTTYSDEEKAAAIAAAEEAAKALTAAEIVTVEDLDAAIAALPINAEVENAASAKTVDQAYNSVSSNYRDWITSGERAEGDLTYVSTKTTDAEGNETITSFIVVMYQGTNDNQYPLVNVRHILISYEGGTVDANGTTVYSEDEKKAAEAKAADLLAQYQSKGATAEVFAELAKTNSTDPGSKDNGGLYKDVYPGQMLAAFNDWCFAEGRKVGDTGMVQTDIGWHVMFFDGFSDTTYRDFLLTNAKKQADVNAWYEAALASVTAQVTNDKYIDKDLVLSAG